MTVALLVSLLMFGVGAQPASSRSANGESDGFLAFRVDVPEASTLLVECTFRTTGHSEFVDVHSLESLHGNLRQYGYGMYWENTPEARMQASIGGVNVDRSFGKLNLEAEGQVTFGALYTIDEAGPMRLGFAIWDGTLSGCDAKLNGEVLDVSVDGEPTHARAVDGNSFVGLGAGVVLAGSATLDASVPQLYEHCATGYVISLFKPQLGPGATGKALSAREPDGEVHRSIGSDLLLAGPSVGTWQFKAVGASATAYPNRKLLWIFDLPS